jgi:hypothetical protein
MIIRSFIAFLLLITLSIGFSACQEEKVREEGEQKAQETTDLLQTAKTEGKEEKPDDPSFTDSSETTESLTDLLPVLWIDTQNGESILSKTESIQGSLSVSECEGYELENLSLSIRGRGNASWSSMPKKSYKIKLSASQKLCGLGKGKSKSWCLLANYWDQSLMRNELTLSLCRELSGISWAPDCRNVELWLNGEYQGVYLLCETVKVDSHRVAISEEVEGTTDIGFLLQMTHNQDEENYVDIEGIHFDLKSRLSEDSSLAQEQLAEIEVYLTDALSAVFTGEQSEIEKYLDLESVIDSYLIEEFVKNLDVGYDSFFLYKDVGGKLTFGPLWDFDLTFGNSRTVADPEGLWAAVDCGDGVHSNIWYYTLMQYDWFQNLVSERWNSEEVQTCISRLPEQIRQISGVEKQAALRNFEVWDLQQNRGPAVLQQLESYEEHIAFLIDWVQTRKAWLDDYFS